MKFATLFLLPLFLVSCSEAPSEPRSQDAAADASPAATTDSEATAPVASTNTPYYPDTPEYRPPADHPEMTRDEQIRALRTEDPSSYGYTDSDRDFLKEHGVSEAEARAIEDVLARQGVN